MDRCKAYSHIGKYSLLSGLNRSEFRHNSGISGYFSQNGTSGDKVVISETVKSMGQHFGRVGRISNLGA